MELTTQNWSLDWPPSSGLFSRASSISSNVVVVRGWALLNPFRLINLQFQVLVPNDQDGTISQLPFAHAPTYLFNFKLNL